MSGLSRLAEFINKLPQANTESTFKTVIGLTFAIGGAVAVIMVVIGGFQYVLSNGDPQRAAKAKNTIIYAIVGLVVAISAFTIVNFVLDKL